MTTLFWSCCDRRRLKLVFESIFIVSMIMTNTISYSAGRGHLAFQYTRTLLPMFFKALKAEQKSGVEMAQYFQDYWPLLDNYEAQIDQYLEPESLKREEARIIKLSFDTPQISSRRIMQTYNALSSGDIKKSELFLRYLEQPDNFGAYHYLMARILLERKKYSAARVEFEKSIYKSVAFARERPEDRGLADIAELWLEGPLAVNLNRDPLSGLREEEELDLTGYEVMASNGAIIHEYRLMEGEELMPRVSEVVESNGAAVVGRAFNRLRYFASYPGVSAAVNGTFFSNGSGKPCGQILIDGSPIFSPDRKVLNLNRTVIAVFDDGSTGFFNSMDAAERLAERAFRISPGHYGRIKHAMGGAGWLVRQGRSVWTDARDKQRFANHYFNTRRPRTVIAQRDGEVSIIVMDGYPSSEPLTLPELSVWLTEKLYDNAVFLDGGGSSALMVEGYTVSAAEGIPSRRAYSFEGRPVSSALVVTGRNAVEHYVGITDSTEFYKNRTFKGRNSAAVAYEPTFENTGKVVAP